MSLPAMERAKLALQEAYRDLDRLRGVLGHLGEDESEAKQAQERIQRAMLVLVGEA